MNKEQRTSAVTSLITEIAVPEFLAFVRRHHEETGVLPTEAEVREHLASDAAGVISRGEGFLRERAIAGAPRPATAADLGVHGGSTGE